MVIRNSTYLKWLSEFMISDSAALLTTSLSRRAARKSTGHPSGSPAEP
ncbi:MAG: hypothetical protein ACTSUE_17450 [Promethearchaeota archaeon]